jgi:hypothetical protein
VIEIKGNRRVVPAITEGRALALGVI